jgi:class 3 adenylate cyclase
MMMDKSPEIGATYLPMEFRQALARGQSLPESAHGAALFSDFSGFTVLAGALAEKHGKTRGAERLAELLRGAFDGIISAIHDYRGSVIGFSGDAVTVWFDDDADTEAPGAVRAVAAAIAMREFVAALPAFRLDETQSLSIAIKVSVSSGPAQRYVVGDPKLQRMAVFAGDTLQRLALADNIAEAGDLILDLDSYDRCAQLLHVAKENPAKKVDGFVSLEDCSMDLQRCPWPSYASLKIEDIRSWLLAEMAESATTGASESLGAFKPIVAVFLKFEGIDYDDDPNAGYQLNTLISRVQQIAADYGGHLVDVTIGDKGSYVFLAFGALKTHEDDAARAIAAVVELRRAGTGVQQLKDAAIGVARGSVYVGEYGGKERRTYGIVGRDIIVAARLMSLADPEQTLVTSHVVDLTKSQFRFDEYAVVDLKGIGEPMTAYTFDALGDSKASSPISSLSTDRLVGREHECGIIDAAIASAEEQTAEMLIIEGEPGIGKSRVLEYLLQKGTRLGKRILVGAADAIGSTSRYHAWNAIFSELMSLPRSQASEQRADVACAYLDENLPHLAQLAPLLSDVIGAQINDNELTRNMTGQVREDNTIDLLTQVLAAYVRHEPVIIVLEDAHWFDSASAALLLRSGEELKNALIVVTRRPISEEFSANAIYSLDQSRAQVMRLGPLSPEAVEELIGDVLQVDNVPPELHDFVVEKAHGSPFFSRELTIALLEANNILVDNKHCKLVNGLSGLEQADFPFTIQGAIGSRIDNLPALQQQVMKVGSVVGREFGYKIVNDLLPSDDDRSELQDSLAQLNKADLIEVVGGLSERKYVFRHVLTQEVAYSMLLHRQRTTGRRIPERKGRWVSWRRGRARNSWQRKS